MLQSITGKGKTWIDRQKLLDGYCGALITMMQTSRGRIVVPVMCMLYRNRHATFTCVSANDGKTWTKPVVIARQPTVGESLGYPYIFERRPGELWIITRYEAKLALSLKEADFVKK